MKIKHHHLLTLVVPFLLSVFSFSSLAKDAISNRSFVEQAAAKSLTTIQSAEHALEVTSSQSVSAYAQKMVNEYKSIHSDIIDLANEKEIDVPKKADAAAAKDAKEMAIEESDDNTFDVAYARNQIAVHQHSISLFQRASKSDDYETRMLANATLQRVQQHLQMAEQLYAATAESKTDIYQDRDNKVDYSDDGEIHRTPSTDKPAP